MVSRNVSLISSINISHDLHGTPASPIYEVYLYIRNLFSRLFLLHGHGYSSSNPNGVWYRYTVTTNASVES